MVIYRVKLWSAQKPPFEHMVSVGPQLIGRASRADIVLAEDSVSRRHAKLYVSDSDLIIEDLGSSNGVVVNGERITKATIGPKDTVQIGCYSLRAEILDAVPQQRFVRRTEIEYNDVAPIHEKLVETDQSSVSFLYAVSQCLCTHRNLNPLLESVLDAVMANIPAERGFVLARRTPEDVLKLATSRIRRPRDSAPPLSHTLVDQVVETKTSIMTTDASQDDRFENSDSIAEFQIKAVICVPLSGHEGVYGAIYIDSDSVPVPLTQKHLQVLSIVGQIVGAGIENIALNDKQIRQERLAGIGETVSGTSHDMRNILMGISGGTEMINFACEEENWKQARDGVRILNQTLTRFKALADNLLNYARVTDLNLEETNLQDLVFEVLEAVKPEAQKRSIDMRFDHCAPSNIVLDSQQMYRVLLNLVKNAMEAMEEQGGTISIESGSEAGAVFIRVRDSGPGILPEHMPRIGQPFFTTKQDKGTGLGLATCFRIMEQHNGKIQVDSNPTDGTTFTLKFPPDYSITRNDLIPGG